MHRFGASAPEETACSCLDDHSREFPELEPPSPGGLGHLESHARQRSEELSVTVDYGSPAAKRVRYVPAAIGRFPIAGRLGSGGQADASFFHPDLQIPVVVKCTSRPGTLGYHTPRVVVQEGRILAGLKSGSTWSGFTISAFTKKRLPGAGPHPGSNPG